MSLYETVFLIRQDAPNTQVDALTEQFKAVITDAGGTVSKVEYWGLKSISFRIRKNRKGHYTLMNIEAPHSAVAEMERQMSLSEDVLRVLTIRVEEHEEGQSAMLRKQRDRDDGDRSFGFGGGGGGGGFGGGAGFGGGGGGGGRARRDAVEGAES